MATTVYLVFSPQNTTSNKYHLSEVSLSAALPDLKGMQTLVTMEIFVVYGSLTAVAKYVLDGRYSS